MQGNLFLPIRFLRWRFPLSFLTSSLLTDPNISSFFILEHLLLRPIFSDFIAACLTISWNTFWSCYQSIRRLVHTVAISINLIIDASVTNGPNGAILIIKLVCSLGIHYLSLNILALSPNTDFDGTINCRSRRRFWFLLETIVVISIWLNPPSDTSVGEGNVDLPEESYFV